MRYEGRSFEVGFQEQASNYLKQLPLRVTWSSFNGWLEDKKSMIRVVEIINRLLPVYLLFAQKRFLDAINLPYNADSPISVKQHDKIKKGFVWFIENMKAELFN